MGCPYSPQRSQSNGKSNFHDELTSQKFDLNSKLNLDNRQHHNVKSITFYTTILVPLTIISLRNFMGCHPALTSCCGHRQDDCNSGSFAISDHTKLILGLCDINEWWRGHRSHTLTCFGRNFVCHMTYLPILPQGRPRSELSSLGDLQQPFECHLRCIFVNENFFFVFFFTKSPWWWVNKHMLAICYVSKNAIIFYQCIVYFAEYMIWIIYTVRPIIATPGYEMGCQVICWEC